LRWQSRSFMRDKTSTRRIVNIWLGWRSCWSA